MAIYQVTFRWVTTPDSSNFDHLKPVMSGMGDWIRANIFSWYLDTAYSALAVGERLRTLLKGDDSVIVVKIELSEFGGFAPKALWEWFERKRLPTTLGGLGSLPPRT